MNVNQVLSKRNTTTRTTTVQTIVAHRHWICTKFTYSLAVVPCFWSYQRRHHSGHSTPPYNTHLNDNGRAINFCWIDTMWPCRRRRSFCSSSIVSLIYDYFYRYLSKNEGMLPPPSHSRSPPRFSFIVVGGRFSWFVHTRYALHEWDRAYVSMCGVAPIWWHVVNTNWYLTPFFITILPFYWCIYFCITCAPPLSYSLSRLTRHLLCFRLIGLTAKAGTQNANVSINFDLILRLKRMHGHVLHIGSPVRSPDPVRSYDSIFDLFSFSKLNTVLLENGRSENALFAMAVVALDAANTI